MPFLNVKQTYLLPIHEKDGIPVIQLCDEMYIWKYVDKETLKELHELSKEEKTKEDSKEKSKDKVG